MKIGFISDIHEDIYSLEKALRLLAKEQCEEIVCLGDMVGFTLPFYRYIETRNADECIRLISENCSTVVIGNHDLFAVRKTPFYNAGFDYGENWYQLDYETRARKSRNRIWIYEDNEILCKLSDRSRDFLSHLDELKTVEFDGVRLFLSHFCYPDFSGSAIHFPGEAFHLKKHFEFIGERNCKISVSGHGHPNGAILVDEEKISTLGFGYHNLKDDFQWIIIPCVARTTRENGVMILDTSASTFAAIPLRSLEND